MSQKIKVKAKIKNQNTFQSVFRSASAVSKTDPDGSYTGRPKDPREIPVQDADDL